MGLHRYRERRDFSRTKQIIISSPERLVWPSLEIRKIDLVRYAEEVGEWFLPHLPAMLKALRT
jgi:DNA primase